jgi:exoribonuclease R
MVRTRIEQKAEASLGQGFKAIRESFQLPTGFPPEVVDEVSRVEAEFDLDRDVRQGRRRDAMEIPFVTLDPTTSTDLDQAFFIERDGSWLVLHYALADVAAFVLPGGAIEREAWKRGMTIYGFAEKVPLYPIEISQHAASLLPDGPRPAILVVVAIDDHGGLKLRSVERVACRSRAKLSYSTVDLSTMPLCEEFARRMWRAESERGAYRFDFPQQEIVADSDSPGGVRLDLVQPLYSEKVNASFSLAANIALAELMQASHIGLFRNMAEPAPQAISRLRYEAQALGIEWSRHEKLRDLLKRLDPDDVTVQRFSILARRAGGRAEYAIYTSTNSPWHSAIASVYAHGTAPMRRLADRYVLELTLKLYAGQSIEERDRDKLNSLAPIMTSSDLRSRNVERAIIDLIEAVSLQDRIGEIIDAEVVDADSQIVQTLDSAIRSRAARIGSAENGDIIQVRIDEADPIRRLVKLTAVPKTAG